MVLAFLAEPSGDLLDVKRAALRKDMDEGILYLTYTSNIICPWTSMYKQRANTQQFLVQPNSILSQ
jgi:hypothetical protein